VIIPGVGFNWAADIGGLIVGPPNNASSTAGTATLTLQPGMGREDTSPQPVVEVGVRYAIVTVNVGTVTATQKVQQFCPQVTTDSSTAPGKIVLNPSSTSISCNGNAFIGALVRDSKGQVPINNADAPGGAGDGTEVTFIATSGRFTGAGLTTTGSNTVRTNATPAAGATPTSGTAAPTVETVSGPFVAKIARNGTLNVIYNADPGTNGQVEITAAAGSAFGRTTITVNCPTAAAGGAFGATGSVFGGGLRPPSTGEGLGIIRPPNTGNGGLVAVSEGGLLANLVSLAALCGTGLALATSLVLRSRRA
jgi:hypothetical protein